MLLKNTFIKIKKSIGRYISLLIIVMVGVGFYAGIKASPTDMLKLADEYYSAYKLMNFKIVSTMGLTDYDVQALKAIDGVGDALPSYSLDVLDADKAIRVHAIEQQTNTLKLISGRMPANENECVADYARYKIGDKIQIASDVSDKLKHSEFTVVGTAESVLYISTNYGNTTVGDGELSSFIFIDKNNFILDAYTEIYVTLATHAPAYSQPYEDASESMQNLLEKIKPAREQARYKSIYTEGEYEIRKNEVKLDSEKQKALKEFADAKTELDDGKQELEDGKAELKSNERKLQKNIKKQTAEFKSARAKLADGRKQIDAALKQSGIAQNELGAKIDELGAGIETMNTQLSQLPADSPQYVQLAASIEQYTQSYEGLKTLKASIDTLDANEAKLNSGVKTFNSKISDAKAKISKGKKEIEKNEAKLEDGYTEYNENLATFNSEMADAQTKIDDAKGELAEIEMPKWHIFSRDAAAGYAMLKSGIDTINAVCNVFPFFFILIVMLMTSNTMARMIAEQRSELGTLTSLGFKDGSIVSTYLLYVLSASAIGAVSGFFIGCSIIPNLIYSNFKFLLPPLEVSYDISMMLIILAVTLVLMSIVTIVACIAELRQKPASLMRPVPPKHGRTILLEKIGIIWNHLSFTWKVTMRNIFRYKKRVFMTIVGVAGCCALLLVGFGLKDSMNGVAEKQYGDIFKYSNLIVLKDETQSMSSQLSGLLEKEKISSPLLVRQSAVTAQSAHTSLDAFMVVPEDESLFARYYNLTDASNDTPLDLSKDGVVITQKLAEVFGVSAGGSLEIKDAQNNIRQLKVSGIAENYVSNYIYMDKDYYKQAFGTSALYNAVVSNQNTSEEFAERLMENDLVLNVVLTQDVLSQARQSHESLNGIIVLIVVVASLLAIIVLYNLTSINISERTREIATLKVLGFTDGETNGYIYREAFVLTLISIGAGLVLGIFMHRFVVGAIEGPSTVFFKKIEWASFALSCAITLVFSLVMQAITFFKLRGIDMIESLKSVE